MPHSTISLGLGLGGGKASTSSGSPGGGGGAFSNDYSLEFDGTNDYISLASMVTLSSEFSLSFWVKPDRNNNNILGNSSVTANYLYTNSSGVLIMSGSFSAQTFTSCTISTGTWTHVAITRDGSNELKCYKNGSLTDTKTSISAAFAFNQLSNYNSLDNQFDGNMDEVAVFSSALSASDVTAIYNSGVPASLSSLNPLGWWRMGDNDGGTGTTITDQGSGSNDGTLQNGPTYSTDVPS